MLTQTPKQRGFYYWYELAAIAFNTETPAEVADYLLAELTKARTDARRWGIDLLRFLFVPNDKDYTIKSIVD